MTGGVQYAAYQQTSTIIDKVNGIINTADKQRQIKKITKIYKYVFGWSRKTIILYILKSIPDLKSRVTEEAIKNANITSVYATMSKKELSLIIKKLEMIERKNESVSEEDDL